MSRLPYPIKNGLREPADEAALQRIWQGIDERLPGPRPRRSRATIVLSMSALAGVAALAVFLGGALRRAPGPLRLSNGQALASVEAPAVGSVLSMSDGSNIRLSPGSRFEPVESSGTSFVAILKTGSGDFEVHPGGPRRWQIECGLATVEVVGTRFACERSGRDLRVSVTHGTVLVRGERVPDHVRRLSAGESLTIAEPAPIAAPPPAVEPAPPAEQEEEPTPANAPPGTAAPARSITGSTTGSTWRDLARRGRHDEAFAVLGAQGVRRETRRLGVEDLFALADVARLSGHPTEAEAPLTRILSQFAHNPQAPLAAFALGRLELDTLGHPVRAAAALDRALALGVPRSLREDVRARLVEAHARAGDAGAARAAANDYRREFPTGRHLQKIDSLTSAP